MLENYQNILEKLDDFVRRYYKNKLIKGGLISIALILSFFLIINILEYFFHLDILGRTIIFYVFLVSFLAVLVLWIIIPVLQLFKMGKIISHEHAAMLIGKFFPEVDDQLLNTIQLVKLSENVNVNLTILNASIEQKSIKFKSFSFRPAISYSVNRKYLKFVIPPVLILLFILFAAPNIITEPTRRIFNHNTFYEIQAPFQFNIENKDLTVIQNQDLELKINISGAEIPNNVFLIVDNLKFRLQKDDIRHFHHLFKSVNKEIKFSIQGDEFESNQYKISVIPKPTIMSFSLAVEYPKYTLKKSETFENSSDISVPAGTRIQWIFNTKDTRLLTLISNDSLYKYSQKDQNRISFKRTLFRDFNYSILTSNEFFQTTDSLKFLIQVIPDNYPKITVDEFKDSLSDSRVYFKGIVKDDYGFTKLLFKYKNKTDYSVGSVNIAIPPSSNQSQFFHFFDLTQLNLTPESQIEYYFEIYDNDAVNGAKASKSQIFQYSAPSEKEIQQMNEKRSDEMKSMFNQSMNEAAKLQKEITKMQEKLNNQKEVNWQDKEKLENLLKRFEKLQKNLEEIKKDNEIKNLKEKEFQKEDERIAEKQKELQELMDKLLTPEMKAMLEEMQKMLEKEVQKQDAMKMLDQLKLENKDIEKQLDRNLEIFKQMEFDSKLQNAIDKLDEIQQKEEKLAETTEKKQADQEQIKKEQDELNKEFSKFQEMMKDADKANKELEKPNDFNKMDAEQEKVQKEMENSSEQLDKGKNNNASKSQKSASEQMKSLSEKMKQQQNEMESEENEEDMAALRDILENLIQTSFNQENLMKKFSNISSNDPKYPSLIQEQKKIKEDLRMIEDSLLALSKRQASIEPFINREIGEINRNVEQTLSALSDLNTIGPTYNGRSEAMGKQQYVLTSVNNLALMLDESLKKMQEEQKQPKNGKGKKCSKPKPGQGMQSLKKMQEEMNKKMKELQQKQKDGKMPNGPGKGQKQGNSLSEEFSKMAAEQEAIRRKVQEYQEKLKKQGLGGEAKELNKIAEEMEKSETELVNRMISEESLKRQQDITTRLLEAEKAERERDEKEERESTEAKDIYQRNFEKFLQYNNQKSKELELLKTIPAGLKPFYKNRVNNYFENIQTF